MKRTLVALSAVVLMIVGTVATASALSIFTDTKELDTWVLGKGTKAWTMAMPTDFQIPYDTVTSAGLTIYSNYVDGNNDIVTVVNTAVGYLNQDTTPWWSFCWNPLEASYFNVAPIITANGWVTGTPLAVSLSYTEKWLLDPIFLDRAVLNIQYENKTAPVPEPGTMVLLGFGMLGLVIYGKRRMNKD